MSFFHLTQLGYQNFIRQRSALAQLDPIRSSTQYGYIALPPLVDKALPPRAILPINQVSAYSPGPLGSHVEFTRMRKKHTRTPKALYQLYNYPITSSHEYGWWLHHEPIHTKLPWVPVPRHVSVKSEMTKFVDKMTLTNREFSLY